jgi:hypothetical protein
MGIASDDRQQRWRSSVCAVEFAGVGGQNSSAQPIAIPFQGGGGGGGSFLDRHEPPNHRHGGSGGGSRNDGNASKPVVPNDQNDVLATIGAAMQQVKKAEGER